MEAGQAGDEALVVTIDGPAAAGKSTVASAAARRLDGLYFDTGVVYRALTLEALERAISPSDEASLAELAESLDVQVEPSNEAGQLYRVRLGDRDVTRALRTPEVDAAVSEVSAHPQVRAALLAHQRRIGQSGKLVVMVGRDIGTVVMPDARVKIWLDASVAERARRRRIDLARAGNERSLDDVIADLTRRDRLDAEREASPMRPANEAHEIQTDGLTIEQVVEAIVRLVEAAEKGMPSDAR